MKKVTWVQGGVCAPKGFSATGVHCGIRKNRTKVDLAMIVADKPCNSAAVYTTNLVKAAPLLVTAKNLKNGIAQALICNSGNANTCNADGEAKALAMCEVASKAAKVSPDDVIVASTGVIGQPLPIEPIIRAEKNLRETLSREGSIQAATAIMTTDTYLKEKAILFEIAGEPCRIGGIAKGSGMINPNMATMLAFLTTDVVISQDALVKALKDVTEDTFNMVSVDGDTSTNDMLSIMASGMAGNKEIKVGTPEYKIFENALFQICAKLSREMAKDGEGATKLITCNVSGAKSIDSARKIARAVINSSLVKTAIFGADANWGRIMCALGYSGAKVDVNAVSVTFASSKGKILVCQNGAGVDFSEELAKEILSENEIDINISCSDGASSVTAYGCDLTYEYVRINGDYRS